MHSIKTDTNKLSIRRGSSFSAYVLSDDSMLSSIDLKLLNGQDMQVLIPAIMSRYNGYMKLTYFSEKYVSLSACVDDLTQIQFAVVMSRVIGGILTVRDNGLLDEQKIDLSHEAIYIDPQNCNVRLIYLPITRKVSGRDGSEQFSQFCQSMFRLMGQNETLTPLIRIVAGFANASLGRFDTLMASLQSNYPYDGSPIVSRARIELFGNDEVDSRLSPPSKPNHTESAGFRLTGYANGVPIAIQISSGSIVVGKSRRADYVIQGIPTISNGHCELMVRDHKLMVRDMGSTNGTYINGRRLRKDKVAPLTDGDTLSLASIPLTVKEVG